MSAMPGLEPTPEDRLLEIIENPLKQGEAEHPALPAVRIKDLATFVAFIRAFDVRHWWRRADLGHLNRGIIIMAIALTVICALNFKRTMAIFDAKLAAISIPADAPEAAVDSPSKNVNFSLVLTRAKEHNIFSLSRDAASVEGLLVGDGQATANLKLVGILWSEKPQAMVEDTVEQKTHLLSVGDQVAQLTVKSIAKDKVVLSREDRVWELR